MERMRFLMVAIILLGPALAMADEHPRLTNSYGRLGTGEIGGSAGFTFAQGTRFNLAPQVGWFVIENLEMSVIASIANVSAGGGSANVYSAVVEPSFHTQVYGTTYGFVGVGVGAAYVSKLGTAPAVAPRVGANILVGRSGIVTPSLSYEYTMHNTMQALDANGNQNVTLAATSSTLRVDVGYSVRF